MAEGIRFTVNTRDEIMLTSLFFARHQRSDQLQQGNFTKEKTCSNRLHQLAKMGLVEYWRPWTGCKLWRLTRAGWEREVDYFSEHAGRYKKKWPKSSAVEHILEINDFYVEIAAELDKMVGEHPDWVWRDEPRSYKNYPLPGNKRGYHRPDAEIHVGDFVFFLERQSVRSKRTVDTFEKKCADYRRYMEYAELDPDKTQVVFTCDTERDERHAHDAAVRYDLDHLVGDVQKTADGLLSEVQKSVPGAKPRPKEDSEKTATHA